MSSVAVAATAVLAACLRLLPSIRLLGETTIPARRGYEPFQSALRKF